MSGASVLFLSSALAAEPERASPADEAALAGPQTQTEDSTENELRQETIERKDKQDRRLVQSGALFGDVELLRTPFSVNTLSEELLIDQQARSLAEALRNDPSVTALSPPGFIDTLFIRGFPVDNSNGFRREGLIFQNQVQTPIENKEAIEVIKGPTALRYGFTNPGGVINYVLKRPTDDPYRRFELFGDNNGGVGAHADFGGRAGEEFGYRINVLGARSASFVDGLDGVRYLASGLFEWRPTAQLRVDLDLEYEFRNLPSQVLVTANSFSPTLSADQREALLDAFDPEVFLGTPSDAFPTNNFVGSLRAVYDISPRWRLTAAVQQMNLTRDQQTSAINFQSIEANGDFALSASSSPGQVRDPLSAETFITGTFKTGPLTHNLTIGGAYSRNPLRFETLFNEAELGVSNLFSPAALDFPPGGVPAGQPVDAIIFEQAGVFFTNFIAVLPSLDLFVGGRFSHQRSRDVFNDTGELQTTFSDGAFTPSAGLIYAPTERLSFYASYAEGLTEGAQAPDFVQNAFEVLAPGRSRAQEIGVKADLFAGATITAAIFNISLPSALVNDENIFVNAGNQRHRGFEFTASGQISENFRLVAGWQYLDAEIVESGNFAIEGNRPTGVPEWQANLFADWTTPLDGFSVNAAVFFTGSKFTNAANSFSVDGVTSVDLGLRYVVPLGKQGIVARVIVRNVNGAEGVQAVSPFGILGFTAPRTAFFSLSREF